MFAPAKIVLLLSDSSHIIVIKIKKKIFVLSKNYYSYRMKMNSLYHCFYSLHLQFAGPAQSKKGGDCELSSSSP